MQCYLKTKNQRYFATEIINGLSRSAFFDKDLKFLHYASRLQWQEAISGWGQRKQKSEDFKFPDTRYWNVAYFKKTRAGNLIVRWRWEEKDQKLIQQFRVTLDKKDIKIGDGELLIDAAMLEEIDTVYLRSVSNNKTANYSKIFG